MKKRPNKSFPKRNPKNNVSHICNENVITENYYRKDMDHTISHNNHYLKTNFDYAASTGSLYKNDIFENCAMYQTDFEFCTFENCKFSSKKKVVSSFNCTDFINAKFTNIKFKACTFTGTLFEKCTFNNVDIQSSTLENALFDNCIFSNMNLSKLNMNFMRLIKPKMNDVILSAEQIPYIFGCMKYLLETSDSVKVSLNGNAISILDYFENEIPRLISQWNEQTIKDYKAYFPLANTYIAINDFNEAQKALSRGITDSVAIRDYRMIKFYCNLISDTDAFDNHQKHLFYNIIKCFSPQNNENISIQRSFIRNIGEIKSILFSDKKKAIINLKFLTNLHINNSQRLQKVIEHIFSISKMKYKGFSNDVEITLCENSPLVISLKVSGDEESIYYLLNQYIGISNSTFNTDNNKLNLQKYNLDKLNTNTNKLITFCSENNVNLKITEYFLENIITESNKFPSCYFPNNKIFLE